MSIIRQLPTNTASTLDWLQASKNMAISAYEPGSLSQDAQVSTGSGEQAGTADADRMFGTHIRETVETVKRWFDK